MAKFAGILRSATCEPDKLENIKDGRLLQLATETIDISSIVNPMLSLQCPQASRMPTIFVSLSTLKGRAFRHNRRTSSSNSVPQTLQDPCSLRTLKFMQNVKCCVSIQFMGESYFSVKHRKILRITTSIFAGYYVNDGGIMKTG